MESLARMVLVMLLVMLFSSSISLLLSWRAGTVLWRYLAAVLGLPGAALGALLIVNAPGPGVVLLGAFGVLGLAVSVYRIWKLRRTDKAL